MTSLVGDESLLEQASVPAFLSRDDLRLGPIDAMILVDSVFRKGRLSSLEMATRSTVLLEPSPQAVSGLPDVGPVAVAAGDFVNDSTELVGLYGVFLAAKDRM